MTNSRDKGKRGELELVHKLNEQGFNCRRGQQFCGSNGDADVVGLDGIHIEVKRVENLNIHKAMEQAVRDSSALELPFGYDLPTVFHRKNCTGWLVTMRFEDWIQFYKEGIHGKKKNVYDAHIR
ncbi:hypothetical protein ACTQ6A_02840 [Lachnospiraceae bacterium LCP25S3_G4]